MAPSNAWGFWLFTHKDHHEQFWDSKQTISTQGCKCKKKTQQNYLDASAFFIVFPQVKHACAAVIACYSIPPG